MHPTHIPLQAEAEASRIGRAGHQRPRGRFLGDSLNIRVVLIYGFIQTPEKGNRLEILSPAILIGKPFPLFS